MNKPQYIKQSKMIGGHYQTETRTGFYTVTASVMKELRTIGITMKKQLLIGYGGVA